MDSKEYWAAREEEALRGYVQDEKEYDRQIQRIYQNQLDAIQKEINSFYGKYASKEGITIAEAKKRVSQLDIAEYERKAAKYVKEKNFSQKANEEMALYNLTMKVNRLELLKANIGLEMIAGTDELDKYMAEILQGRTEDELKRMGGILGKSVKANSKKAAAIPNASFHNATFSDRIWMYQDLLKAELSKLLQTGLIQGKNPRALASELKKVFDTSTYNAERLMRTELARVQTEAQKQSFQRNGFSLYEYIANSNCCDICQGFNGKHFKVESMMPGENAPPMHPNCRCSTAAWEDSEEYDAWVDYLANGGTTEKWNASEKFIFKSKRRSGGTAEWEKLKAKQAAPAKNTFTPAKTIKEAEAFANNNGVKYADYSKLPLETANLLNEAIGTLPSDVRPVFMGASTTLEQYWGGKLPRSSKQYYGVHIDAFNGIYVNGRLDMDTYGSMVGISSSYKTAKKITEAKAAAQQRYVEKTGRKWFFNTDGRTTAFHEIGHIYAEKKGLPEGFEFDAKKWAAESQCDMLKSTSEAWAEAWAAYYTGNPDLPGYISEYIKGAK